MPPRILCITRAYPPVVGGMERLSSEFTEALSQQAEVTLVANRRGKAALPWFLPYAALKLQRLAPPADVVHLGDALLTLLLLMARPRRPVAVTIHGLDIRYPHPLYQTLITRCLPRVDLALCISRFVEQEFRTRFPTVRTLVMNPGINESFYRPGATRADLGHALAQAIPEGRLLLAVARLVPRKGLAWFVSRVLPRLAGASLLIIGDGPERTRIEAAATRSGVRGRVLFAGAVPDKETLKLAYSTADLFVMPNVPVPGDAEGFGLVALEAASAGLPVIAARLEGITDAVVEGQTGILLPLGEPAAWVAGISRLLGDPLERRRLSEHAPLVIGDKYSWQRSIANTLDHLRALGA